MLDFSSSFPMPLAVTLPFLAGHPPGDAAGARFWEQFWAAPRIQPHRSLPRQRDRTRGSVPTPSLSC